MSYLLDAAAYIPLGFAASIIFLVIHEIGLRVKNQLVSWFHRIMFLVLGLFLTALFALTVSPIYGFSLSHFGNNVNLVPLLTLDTTNLMNFWGNILLFVPLGVLLVLLSYGCRRFYTAIFIGIRLSLLIEIQQLFSTRGTDINDIILNTAGTLCGYFLGRLILYITPSLRKKIGILTHVNGKYCRINNDKVSITVLTIFILISVYATGLSIKAADIPQPTPSVDNNSEIAISPMPSVDNNSEIAMLPTPPIDNDWEIAVQPENAALPIPEEIEAKNAYLWNVSSNTILYEKEGDQRIAPASTTKLLTALTVLDFCDENDEVLVGEEIERIAQNASRAWLYTGNRLTVRQLLVALLLPSGNDAAYALAVFAGRKICDDDTASIDKAFADFVAAMNVKAADIGADHSKFLNPDGYDVNGQYTTAYDLACIAKTFMKTSILMDIAGSYRISDVWLSGQEVTYYNTNELLNPESPYYYECIAGLKTGKSEDAGCCLISCAYIDDELYVCVVMDSTEDGRWQDSLALYRAIQQ